MNVILLSNSWNPSSMEKTHCMAMAMEHVSIATRVIPLCNENKQLEGYYSKYGRLRKYEFCHGAAGSLWKGHSKVQKFFNNLRISFNFAKILRKEILLKKPDAVILPQGSLEMNFIALLNCGFYKIPVIGNIMEYKPAFASYRNLNSKLEWWLIFRFCKAYFTISHFLFDRFRQVKNRMYLPVIIDFSSSDLDLKKIQGSDPPILIYTNSPTYIDLLLFCLEALSKITLPFQLVVTGRYSNLSRIEQKIDELGLKGKVKFTGYISDAELEELQMESRALLVPLTDDIQHIARFPQKILNYMLYSKPVVSSNVGEIPFFFTDGVSALIDKQNTTEGFSGKIQFVLEKVSESNEIGMRGKQIVQEKFSAAYWAEPMRIFIEKVCE